MKVRYKTCSILLVIIMICSVCIPHVLSFVETLGAPSYTYGNTNSNLSNYGLLAEYDGKIYFANSADGNRLYVMKEDGTAYKKICDDEVQYINVTNGVIYYVNLSDGNKLYSIKIDGTARTKLGDDQCAYVNVVNTTIYYISITDGWKIKSCDLTGKTAKLVNNTVTAYNLNVLEDKAYYINLSDGLIYRMVLSTGAATVISSAPAHQIVAYGGYVFYINATNSRVYRINASGAASQKVYNYTNYTCSHLAVTNDIIYFSMNEKNGIIGSLEIGDFYSDTDVSGMYASCLNASKSYLYFSHVYENNSNFIYYGDTHRITYDGKTTQSMEDVATAATVMGVIDGLPSPDAVTREQEDAVLQAKIAFESLAKAQADLVLPAYVEKLKALEARLELDGPLCIVSEAYAIDHATHLVTGLKQQTAVTAFVAAFAGDNGLGTVKILNTAGEEVASGNVGTGYQVQLVYAEKTVETLTVILQGDLNGDSRLSAMDLLQMQKHLLKMITLEGATFTAADINQDGRVSAMDLLQLQKHLLKMIVIA